MLLTGRSEIHMRKQEIHSLMIANRGKSSAYRKFDGVKNIIVSELVNSARDKPEGSMRC